MKKYDFSNYDYVRSHGKAPKGTCHWAFVLENAVVEGIAPETKLKHGLFWGYKWGLAHGVSVPCFYFFTMIACSLSIAAP